jgi:hypothetical protein
MTEEAQYSWQSKYQMEWLFRRSESRGPWAGSFGATTRSHFTFLHLEAQSFAVKSLTALVGAERSPKLRILTQALDE